MQEKFLPRIRLAVLAVLAIFTFACSSAARLSLESLEKVDNYPFYTMTYYGSYYFDQYLKTGNNELLPFSASQRESDGFTCTCFSAMAPETDHVYGRNFDYFHHICMLLFTDPSDAYASVSMVDLGFIGYGQNHLPDNFEDRGNLVYTPYFPFDGMNEKGVAVGIMAVPHAEAPFDPSKVTIGEVQLVRLVLDYAKDVDEAISLIRSYNIEIQQPPIHYLIADPSGNSAIVEFVSGEMVVIRNSKDWQVCTNFVIHGTWPSKMPSCWRYNLASETLEDEAGNVNVGEAMDLLENVSQGITMWSAVYNMKTGEVQIAVGRDYNIVRTFKLLKFSSPQTSSSLSIPGENLFHLPGLNLLN